MDGAKSGKNIYSERHVLLFIQSRIRNKLLIKATKMSSYAILMKEIRLLFFNAVIVEGQHITFYPKVNWSIVDRKYLEGKKKNRTNCSRQYDFENNFILLEESEKITNNASRNNIITTKNLELTKAVKYTLLFDPIIFLIYVFSSYRLTITRFRTALTIANFPLGMHTYDISKKFTSIKGDETTFIF